jgi:hypothetical protein
MHCCNGLHPLWRLAQPIKVAWPTWAFRPGTKQGSPPFPHRRVACRPNPVDRRRVAGEGGDRELAPEVRILIWCICSGGSHRGRLAAAKQVSAGEPVTAGRRRGGGRLLRVHGAAVSSGGGRCGDGGALRWPEVVLNGKAASTTETDGRLGAPTVPCGGQWLSGRLGMA